MNVRLVQLLEGKKSGVKDLMQEENMDIKYADTWRNTEWKFCSEFDLPNMPMLCIKNGIIQVKDAGK